MIVIRPGFPAQTSETFPVLCRGESVTVTDVGGDVVRGEVFSATDTILVLADATMFRADEVAEVKVERLGEREGAIR